MPESSRTRVLVVTGDHGLPDPTKWDGRYSPDDLALHDEMRAALEGLSGYSFRFLTDHDRLLDRLVDDPPELVLNFCDTGFRNVATQEIHIPVLLEVMGIPYSGASPAGMTLCYDKAVTRMIATSLGVPTPTELYLPPSASVDDLEIAYPALVKPALGDGSVGINRNAVIRSDEEARRQLAWFRKELPGRAALIQEYLPGPEYGLALIGNPDTGFTALPPLQVDFGSLPADVSPILAFESKTGPENPYDNVRVVRANLPPSTLDQMRSSAERLFERLSCRDYARFDFRQGDDQAIKLMEVNPNPAWSAAGKLALMAGFAGLSYPKLLKSILDTASVRVRTTDAES